MAGIISNDRDNLLATFQVSFSCGALRRIRVIFKQAATGLDDIGTSISVLEQHGWNLVVSRDLCRIFRAVHVGRDMCIFELWDIL